MKREPPPREKLRTERDPESLIRRLDEVLKTLSPTEDRFVTATARSVLKRVEWKAR